MSITAPALDPAASPERAAAGPIEPTFELLPVAAFVLDGDSRVVSVNGEFEIALGYSRDELRGRNAAAFYRRDELPRLVDAIGRLRRGDQREVEDRWILRTAAGGAVAARVRMRAVQSGAARLITGVILGLGEQGAESFGRFAGDEMFRALFVDSPVPMTIQDADYRVVEVNPAYCRWIEREREQIVGRDPLEWMAREQHEEVWRRRSEDPLRAGVHGVVRRALSTPGGAVREARLHYCAVFDRERRIHALVSAIDLSDEVELQRRLESQARSMESFFELAPVAFVIRDEQLRIRRVNRAFAMMSGYRTEELAGRSETLLPPGDAPALEAIERMWQMALRAPGAAGRARVPLVTREGRRLLTDRLSTMIEDPAGKRMLLTAVNDITQQHALEEELKRLVLQQGALLRTMSSGVMMVVRDRVIRCNASLERLLGVPAERIIGRSVGEVLRADRSWAAIGAESGDAIDSDASWGCEIDLRRGDDDVVVCALQLRRVDPSIPETGLIVTLHDITELKRQQAGLLQANAELSALVENSAVAIAYLDGERFVRANAPMGSLLGCEAGALAGKALRGFVLPGDQAGSELLGALGGDARVPGTIAARLLRTDSSTVHCLVHHGPIDPRRRPRDSILVAIDVSGQQAALNALAESQERFGRFAEAVDEAVFVIGAQHGRALYANSHLERVLGVRADEFRRDPGSAWRFVDPDDRGALEALLADSRDSGPHEAELRIAVPGRAATIVRLRLFRAGADGGELYGLAEDVTQHRDLAQRRIDEAIAQRDTLVREVHHRIKNNLQGVAGLLQQSAIRRPEIAAQLDEIVGQIQAIAQVHGLQVREKGELSFARIAKAVFENLARGFGHSVELAAQGFDSVEQWTVPEQEAVPLALVVNELGTNAIKHCDPARGTEGVSVELDMLDQALVLRIRNPGQLAPGFSLERMAPSPSGLGLIRALLPRRGTRLALSQQAGVVLTELQIGSPVIRRAAAR